MVSEAKCTRTRERRAEHTPLALASPFACHSRDSSEWSACSRAFFEVARETGSVSCRIALWDCFGDAIATSFPGFSWVGENPGNEVDAIATFIGYYQVAQETGPRIFFPKNSPMVQFDTTPTQSHARPNVSSNKDANYVVLW